MNLITKTDILAWKPIAKSVDDGRIDPFIVEAQEFDLQEALGTNLYCDMIDNLGSEDFLIDYSNIAVSTFQVGEIVKGMSGTNEKARGEITANNAGVLTINTTSGSWRDAVTLFGNTSNTTADIDSIAYGKYDLLLNGESYTDLSNRPNTYKGLIPALCYWAYARFIENQQITVTPTGVDIKNNEFTRSASQVEIARRISQARNGALAYFNKAERYLNFKNSNAVTYEFWRINTEKKSGGVKISTVNRFDREASVDYLRDERIYKNG